jgi:ADP-ribose pyrophosphatase
MRFKLIDSREVFKGEVLSLKVDTIELPSGRKSEREVITHRGAVGIIPVDENGMIMLVSQFRHAVDKYLLEIPAGKLDAGETPLECGRRELEEEIGVEAGVIDELARFYTTPGYSDEFFHLYIALELKKGKASQPEEEITGVVEVTFDEAMKMIKTQEIEDGKTIAAIGLALEYLKSKA